MNDSSAREMNERQPQRPCGYVGIFFQFFDQNRRFAKKLFPKKLLSLACLKQASKKFGGDEKQPKLRLNNGMTDTRCESKREMKAPSLVARLMGLESMPTGSGSKPQKASASETWSNVADKLGARPGGSDKEDIDLEMAKIKSSEPEDKVLAESVDSVDDEPLFPKPDRDLSDCETSLSTRRSCIELIHNVSRVLSKIDQLKGSKLSYAKQVILNAKLIFGTTPQQQALPVEDGFSVTHFLLNEHEMFSIFLWMAFSELLGCNDPKQMYQLKGFAFDCLLEYLDSKFSQISDSGFRTCTKLPSGMTKEILITDIIDEFEEWTQFVGLIPNELIEWDMSHSLGKCTDFEIEEYECGTEVAMHILQELIDEVVLDLYSSS
ncbi:hypothetical protein BC332_26433 [Capsicum chinense]|nr:hypothetical protein BC332_26433 [Capsicum chinense]